MRKNPKAFKTISEVADEIQISQHTLRFWETKFPQIRPLKRGGGRRCYRPEEVELLRKIADLLHVQGYTIKGVQKLLRDEKETAALLKKDPASDQNTDVGEAEQTDDVFSDERKESLMPVQTKSRKIKTEMPSEKITSPLTVSAEGEKNKANNILIPALKTLLLELEGLRNSLLSGK